MRPSRGRRALAAVKDLAEAPVRLLRPAPSPAAVPDAATILSAMATAPGLGPGAAPALSALVCVELRSSLIPHR